MTTDRPVAMITGACGGIGQALVHAFAGAGYRIIGTDLGPLPSRLLLDHFIAADLERLVEDRLEADRFFAEARACLGATGLTVLVNNAAVQIVKRIEELSTKDVVRTFTVNAIAPFLLTRALLPELERERGSVVNISSIHAALTKPGFTAYAASKAALSGLTRALSVELGNRVRVNAIEPAAISTPMLVASFVGNDGGLTELADIHPVGRIGEPREVADLAVFVASDQARFINGAIFGIDGGISHRLHDPS